MRHLKINGMIQLNNKSQKFAEWIFENRVIGDIINFKGVDFIVVEVNDWFIEIED